MNQFLKHVSFMENGNLFCFSMFSILKKSLLVEHNTRLDKLVNSQTST